MGEERIAELLKSIIAEIKKITQDYLSSDEYEKLKKKVEELKTSYQKGDITLEEKNDLMKKLEEENDVENKKLYQKIDSLNGLSIEDVKDILKTLSTDFFLDNDFNLPPKSNDDLDAFGRLISELLSKIENEPPQIFNDLITNNEFVSAIKNIDDIFFSYIIAKCDSEEAITTFFTTYLQKSKDYIDEYVFSIIFSSFIGSERVSPEFVDRTIFDSDNSPFIIRNVVNPINISSINNKRKMSLLLNSKLFDYAEGLDKDEKRYYLANIFRGLASSCETVEDCLNIINLMKDKKEFFLPSFIMKINLPKEEMIRLFFHEDVFDKIKESIGFILDNSEMDFETFETILFDERVLSQKNLDVTKVLSNNRLTADQLDKIISDDRISFDGTTSYDLHNLLMEIFTQSDYPISKKLVFVNNPKSRAVLDNKCLTATLSNPLVPIEEANKIFLDKRFFYKMIGEYNEEYNNDPKAKKGPFKYDKYEYVKSLIEKNPYVVRTLSYSLLDDQILDMGPEFIDKLSRDFDASESFASKYTADLSSPYLKNMILSVMGSRYKDDINLRDYISRLTDSVDGGLKMPLPGARFISKTKAIRKIIEDRCLDISTLSESNWKTLTEIALRDSSAYTVKYSRTFFEVTRDKADWTLNIFPDVNSKEDLDNFEARRIDMCNKSFLEAVNNRDLDGAKNAYFNKYFSVNLEEATEIGRLYSSAPSEFENDPKYRMQVKYVELILKILKINNIDELVKSFNYPLIPITFDENIHIDRRIKDMYSKQISDSVYRVHGEKKTIKVGDREISVYEPDDEFVMLIHSTDAYGKLEIINDNYDDSWNKGTRTTNHGICCSLIANDNLGMAEVKDVLFGFDGWDPKAVSLMAPYDIFSINDSYDLKESREMLFLSARGIINNTRHTHNEIVLEREELRQGRSTKERPNIQPSYVIIYSDMTDELKQKAIKCSEQMNIPIVYLDKEKIAQRECAKIDSKIEQLKQTHNIDEKIELLKDILLTHENNRSGCKQNNPEFLETYFPTDKIGDVIKLVIAEMKVACEDSKDVSAYYNQSAKLMSILDEENQKYVTLSEAAKRINEMDLDIEVYENTLVEFIDPEITKYSTPKLKEVMESEPDNDDSLSQIIKTVNQEELSSKVDYIVQKGLYKEDGKHHNIGHIERVLFFSNLVGNDELKNQEGIVDNHAMELLEKSALYHDCGRTNDRDDSDHGFRSSLVAEEQLRSEGYSIEDIAIIKSAIEYHEIVDDDVKFQRICSKNGVPPEKVEYAKKIAICLKDADALDRTRFISSTAGLNPDYLRTQKAKDSVKIAEKLNDRYRKINKKVFENECKKRIIEQTLSLDDQKKGVDPDAKSY